MTSKIISNIKRLKFFGLVIFFYGVVYNTYYGWNVEPISEMESMHDNVLKVFIYLWIGFFIKIVLDYMEFIVWTEIYRFKNNKSKD